MDVKLFCGFPSPFWFPLFLPKDSVYLSSQSLCVLSLVMKNAYDGFGCTYIYILLVLSVCSCFPTATPTCTYIYVYTHRGLCALKMRFISLVKPPAGIIVLQPWHTGHTDSDSECGWLQPGLTVPRSWTWQSLSPQPQLCLCSHLAILAHPQAGCNLTPAQTMPRMQQQHFIWHCFILKHGCRRGRWHQLPSFVTQLVQQHGRQHSSDTAPLPPPAPAQPSQLLMEAGNCPSHQSFAAMDQSKWTLTGHVEELMDPKGRGDSQGRFLRRPRWVAQLAVPPAGSALGLGTLWMCKWGARWSQEPAWDERQHLQPLLPAQLHLSLHHHWHLSPLHAITTRISVIFISSCSSAAQNFLLVSFSLSHLIDSS